MKAKERAVLTLNPLMNKILKIAHVVFVASVFGGILAMVALLAVKTGMKPDENAFFTDLAIFRVYSWPVTYGFFCIIFSSFIFGFFTEWGFIRFWWVIVKWIALIFLFAMAWFILGPAVNGMVSLSDAGYHLGNAAARYRENVSTALAVSVIFLVCLLFMMILSVLKPWGRTKSRASEAAVNRAVILWIVVGLAVVGLFFGVVGSVVTSRYRNLKIADTDTAKLKDGTFTGEAEMAGYVYRTVVVIRNKKIVSVKAVDNRKSPYAYLAEGVFRKVLKNQNANVDVITGATTTSKALLKSVENALSKSK